MFVLWRGEVRVLWSDEKGVGELRVLILTEYDRRRGTVVYELPVFVHLGARCAKKKKKKKKRKKRGDPLFPQRPIDCRGCGVDGCGVGWVEEGWGCT